MKRRSMLLAILPPVVWVICLLIRCLACWDALETQSWYLYVIAIMCALLQYASILVLYRYTSIRNIGFFCGMPHACCIAIGLPVFGESALLTLSVALDAIGLLLAFGLHIRRLSKNRPK